MHDEDKRKIGLYKEAFVEKERDSGMEGFKFSWAKRLNRE
jgi:hypothetical protein